MAEKLDKTEENAEVSVTEEGAENAEENRVPPEIDSKYRLILLAAQRSKQLQKGATPRVTVDARRIKPTRIALKELDKGKVFFEITDIN